MAHLSGDAALMEAFRSGEDLHTHRRPRGCSGSAPEAVTPLMRSRIKAMSYGLAYGLSAYRAGPAAGHPAEEARGLMDEYFQRFGGVRDYLHGVVGEARATGLHRDDAWVGAATCRT